MENRLLKQGGASAIDTINKKCQVFTPEDVVVQLLDSVGYKSDLCGKRVAENSCGDGNILVEIVRRYIEDGQRQEYSIQKIKDGLQRDIYGAEIDERHKNNSAERLDELALSYGICGVQWNIYNGDFLRQGIRDEFHFVIGNPPYITYKEINLEDRDFLRGKFLTCGKGKFDFCYAFTEASIISLNSEGKLAYLIPGNVFKNQFAGVLRKLLLTGLTDIYDFTNRKLFEDKLTVSSIIVYDAAGNTSDVNYHDVVAETEYKIPKEELTGKWRFVSRLSRSDDNGFVRFGDMFHAASSIATLLNEVYIIDKFVDCGDYVVVDGEHKIEKGLLRNAVSPRSFNYKKQERVVFPYYYQEGILRRYSEKEFADAFPFGEKYLRQHEEKLSRRDSDHGSRWFEYGRSQALAHLNQQKLLISTLVTDAVKTYLLDADTIPTSGLYIVSKSGYEFDTAEKILKSSEFYAYVKSIGVISNGSSYRISPKDINDYTFERRCIE